MYCHGDIGIIENTHKDIIDNFFICSYKMIHLGN